MMLALYSLPTAVRGGDAGEFATVMLEGGVAHPPGYPWMRVLGLVSRLLRAVGLPAMQAAALPSALLGVGAAWLAYRLIARFAPPTVAAVSVFVWATSELFVVHVDDAEVWGGVVFATAFVLWFCLRRSDSRRLVLEALVVGLAASHHLTLVFFGPMLFGRVLDSCACPRLLGLPVWVRFARQFALSVVGGLLGMSMYLSLLVPLGGEAWIWGNFEEVGGLWHHFLRRDYGTFQLSTHAIAPSIWALWGRMFESLGRVYLAGYTVPAWLVCGVLVAGVFAARRRWSQFQGAFGRMGTALGFLTSLAVMSFLFPGLHNIDPNTLFGAWILERFDLMPSLCWLLPICLGLSGLVCRLARQLPTGSLGRRLVFGAVGLCLVFRLAHTLIVLSTEREDASVERYAQDVLATAGGHRSPSVVIGTGDHRSFPVLYVQEVLQQHRDVVYVDASLLAYEFYRRRIAERLNVEAVPQKPLRLLTLLWSREESKAWPVYLTHSFSRPAARLSRFPEGVLWRVQAPPEFVRRGAPALATNLEAVVERHLSALSRCSGRAEDFAGTMRVGTSNPWGQALALSYVEGSQSLVRRSRQAGNAELSARLGAQLQPWMLSIGLIGSGERSAP